MLISDSIQVRSNVFVTARERGKKIPSLCHEGHNRWVNLGRTFLANAVRPTAAWGHYSPDVIKYMGFGIGGEHQITYIAPGAGLGYDYPGQNSFADDDISVSTLERPIKVSGTAGRGTAAGVWLQPIVVATGDSATPSLIGTPPTTIEFMCLFTDTGELDLGGSYPNIPLSELGLYTSAAAASMASNVAYDYASSPGYIGPSRQTLVAYHSFSPISRTPSISLEVRWQLIF